MNANVSNVCRYFHLHATFSMSFDLHNWTMSMVKLQYRPMHRKPWLLLVAPNITVKFFVSSFKTRPKQTERIETMHYTKDKRKKLRESRIWNLIKKSKTKITAMTMEIWQYI
jgi:hypothetical protein